MADEATELKKEYFQIPKGTAYSVIIGLVGAALAAYIRFEVMQNSVSNLEARVITLETRTDARFQKVEANQEKNAQDINSIRIEVITKLSEIKILIEQEKNQRKR